MPVSHHRDVISAKRIAIEGETFGTATRFRIDPTRSRLSCDIAPREIDIYRQANVVISNYNKEEEEEEER